MTRMVLFNPFLQGGGALIVMVILAVLFRLTGTPVRGWDAAALVILGWGVVNAVIGIFAPSPWFYIAGSIAVFISLFAVVLLMAPLLTGLSYGEYGEHAMIFAVPAFYYPPMLAVLGLIRFVRWLIMHRKG